MELKKHKQDTLFWLFLKQLLLCGVYILILIFVYFMLFSIGLNRGIILPADYSAKLLEQNHDAIKTSAPFDKNLIPFTCYYGLFDSDKNYIDGNFYEKTKDDALKFLENPNSAKKRYYSVEREDGYCVVNYDINAHFASPDLNRLFPKLELMIITSFILSIIAVIILTAFSFGKKLKKQLKPLFEQLEQIKNKELDFKTRYCKVREFNDVLTALDNMRTALSQSLKNEWETEQKRNFHISALAHDIKTPLTIIKGNAELIKEENALTEIYKFADNINKSTDKIERYIKFLVAATKNNSVLAANFETVKLKSLIHKIISESENLCKTKNISLLHEELIADAIITIDKDLLLRAILNVVKNAVEYSSYDSKICMRFFSSEKEFSIDTEDFSCGFSEEALKNAKGQFYTEKKERAAEHYGLGLYIADSVAKINNGSLELLNKPDKSGAIVKFMIRI